MDELQAEKSISKVEDAVILISSPFKGFLLTHYDASCFHPSPAWSQHLGLFNLFKKMSFACPDPYETNEILLQELKENEPSFQR